MDKVRISKKGAARLAAGHPWVYRSDLIDAEKAQPGATVTVADPSGRSLGVAHYSSTSLIALRLLDRGHPPIDASFYRQRLERAQAHRNRHVRGTDCYRLVHGEADQLPGLIIDRYGSYFVLQAQTQGMDAHTPWIAEALTSLYNPAAIVARNEATVRAKESLPQEVRVLQGEAPEQIEATLNGLRWRVNLLKGQKTGIFLDQRENYRAILPFSRGRALDCYTSTGGFALHMAAVCESVEGVDSSEEALKTAEWNRQANSIANVSWREADVFDILASFQSARRHYDTIVLDPPAFAKSRASVEAALRAYREINTRALKLLNSGGTLISCSCSHHISEATLFDVIAHASLDASRTLRVLARFTQALDHPILLTVPETSYLKCLVLEVA